MGVLCICHFKQLMNRYLIWFPSLKYEAFKQEEADRLKRQPPDVSPDVYFIKQTIGNACGTIGMIHVLANNQKYLEMGRFLFLIVITVIWKLKVQCVLIWMVVIPQSLPLILRLF